MSLRLYVEGGQGHHDIDNESDPDLKKTGDFATVLIQKGTWIFYDNKNYNHQRESVSKILGPDEDRQSISTVNGSVYLIPPNKEGIVLFAHPLFSGHRKVTM